MKQIKILYADLLTVSNVQIEKTNLNSLSLSLWSATTVHCLKPADRKTNINSLWMECHNCSLSQTRSSKKQQPQLNLDGVQDLFTVSNLQIEKKQTSTLS